MNIENRNYPFVKARPYTLPAPPPSTYYADGPDPAVEGDGAVMFVEDTDDFDLYTYRLRRILYNGRTAFQKVMIGESLNYGLILALDGAIQSAQDDEALYHEILVHPAMLRHPEPRDVLIVGGGEGATLREVLAYSSVRSATMVDIDRELVELCREHLVSWHRGAFDDPRAHLVFEDGRKFLESHDAKYDVVIIDLVDMLDNGPAQALYTRQFYELLRRHLRPDAIVAIQAMEFSFTDDKQHAALARTLRCVFPEVHSYRTFVPSFLGPWGFIVASDWFRPQDWDPADIDRAVENRLGNDWLDHVTGDFIRASFVHCKETLFLLSQPGPILEDGVPFVPPPYIEDIEPPIAQFPAVPGTR